MKKREKQEKAITLVALVVTIIILLILTGISIQALTNQGVFTQAQKAKNLTEEKTVEENTILTNYLEQMNAIIGGQVTESVLDGATVTPINDITTWLKTGGISKQYSYTTIEQVIADSTCTQSLMNNENAMKYLARSTEFANAICESETAMTYLGKSAYVDDTLLNSESWYVKIISSSYYNLVLDSLVWTMTGDTIPYGEVSSSGAYDSTYAYYAFDNDDSTYWKSATNSVAWVTYKFEIPICVKTVKLKSVGGQRGIIYASNDNSNWVKLCTYDGYSSSNTDITIQTNNSNEYLYYKIYCEYAHGYPTFIDIKFL